MTRDRYRDVRLNEKQIRLLLGLASGCDDSTDHEIRELAKACERQLRRGLKAGAE